MRRARKRREQFKRDSIMANQYAGVKSNDGCVKVFEQKLDPMPERKLTYKDASYTKLGKNTYIKGKVYHTHSQH